MKSKTLLTPDELRALVIKALKADGIEVVGQPQFLLHVEFGDYMGYPTQTAKFEGAEFETILPPKDPK